jgi:putative transposase
MSGISENKSVNIGSNVNYTIGNEIKRINKIKDNENIPNKIKKKNEILINRKIRNKIDDLHWKSINYLVKNYNTILVGDMSASKIVNKNKSILSNIQKVACLRTKYYQFNQRLEYKCKKYNVNFKLVDESFTSKTCSYCANYDENLRISKIYNCKKCLSSIDRDINGARNIYIKNLL